jgi:hypothetical protein
LRYRIMQHESLQNAVVAALVAGVAWVVFVGIDFGWGHPSKYQGGPDIPLSGGSRWVLPSADDFNESDIKYLARGGRDLISALLVRDTGNHVFVRVELLDNLQLGGNEERDLMLAFDWGKEEEEEPAPLPGTPGRIDIAGGWRAALLIRDNATSSLWGASCGEISPTHVERTYFDNHGHSITLVFSKLLLISAGWDGESPISMSAFIFRDGGYRMRDYEAMGDLRSGGWGPGGWSWTPIWVRFIDSKAP